MALKADQESDIEYVWLHGVGIDLSIPPVLGTLCAQDLRPISKAVVPWNVHCNLHEQQRFRALPSPSLFQCGPTPSEKPSPQFAL